ncbi:MAG: hypothetical protein EBR28_05580 [Planctomycetia bacterium]|nr:hypothetical protein [Planctomycetia bacterium]
MLDEVGHVVAMAVPVRARVVAALGHQHRPASLRQEQQGEARRHHRILDAAAAECSGELVLAGHEDPGTLEVPVRLADEPAGGEPAHPLQAIEIVVVPGLAAARVLAHAEPLAQPVEPALERLGG